MNKNWEKFQQRLEQEKEQLEVSLSAIGKKINVEHNGDWEAIPTETGEIAFRDETADRLEELQERQATEVELEQAWRAVNLALAKITAGTFGQCEICHQDIESERLEALPYARTCKQHLDQERAL